MFNLTKRKERVARLTGYIFLTLLLVGFSLSQTGEYSNTVILDPLRTKAVPSDAVVIAIDDTTLKELGAWPLKRDVYVDLLQSVHDYGIKGMVFDVLFLEPKEGDDRLSSALRDAPYPVILGSKKTESGTLQPVFQEDEHLAYGFVNVSPDKDGKVRRFVSPDDDRSHCTRPLSLAIFSLINGQSGCVVGPTTHFLYPKDVPVFSLADIVNKKVPKDLLRGKLLFVGATTLDLEDYFVGLEGFKVPGVLVHTAMYTSYSNQLQTQPIGTPGVVIMIMLIVGVGASFVRYIKRPVKQIAFVSVFVCVLVVTTVVLFDMSYEMPLVSLMLSFFGSFVLSTLFHYASSRRENVFIRTMFSRYVNKEVLNELLENHSTKQTGEKRNITVLFSDLRGFTNFSETLDPEALLQLLNYYFTSMVAAIFKENGTVDKFIGDAVMAFWNAPLTIHNHEYHAVRAAIGMQEALTKFNKDHGTDLRMGIGVHTGPAIIGNVGGAERASYTAFGDTVNTASRIESVTKKYGAGIVVSKEVAEMYEAMKDDSPWTLRKLDEVRLKGKQKSTTLFEIGIFEQSLVREYEEAFQSYQEKDFDTALSLLRGETLKNDIPSKVLVERIESGVLGRDFDGVWAFDEK